MQAEAVGTCEPVRIAAAVLVAAFCCCCCWLVLLSFPLSGVGSVFIFGTDRKGN